jgi:hypothetical protein
MLTFNIELTDTFGGEANYSWVRRASVVMPELTHYGYDGSHGYSKANKVFERELIKKAKKAIGLCGKHIKETWGDTIVLRYPSSHIVCFIDMDLD